MRNVFFGVQPKRLKELGDLMNIEHPERDIVLVPFADVQTKAPTKSGKYKGYHQIKITGIIPDDAIKGSNAILDFGGFIVMDIDRVVIASHLKGGGYK